MVGSAVRGEDRTDSDVDFLVDFEPGRSLPDQLRGKPQPSSRGGCPATRLHFPLLPLANHRAVTDQPVVDWHRQRPRSIGTAQKEPGALRRCPENTWRIASIAVPVARQRQVSGLRSGDDHHRHIGKAGGVAVSEKELPLTENPYCFHTIPVPIPSHGNVGCQPTDKQPTGEPVWFSENLISTWFLPATASPAGQTSGCG